MNNNFLNKVVDKLVGESIIDYKTKAVYLSDFPVPFNNMVNNLIQICFIHNDVIILSLYCFHTYFDSSFVNPYILLT